MMKRKIEQLRGNGIVSPRSGSPWQASYEIDVLEELIEIGPGRDPAPGLREVVGRVLPVRQITDLGHELLLEDGRRLRFYFSDAGGSIAFMDWVD